MTPNEQAGISVYFVDSGAAVARDGLPIVRVYLNTRFEYDGTMSESPCSRLHYRLNELDSQTAPAARRVDSQIS